MNLSANVPEDDAAADLMQQYSECVASMQRLRPLLAKRHEQARAEVVTSALLLKKIDRSIKNLEAGGSLRRTKRSASSEASPDSNCTNKDELLSLIVKTLEAKGRTTVNELKKSVAAELRLKGRSLSVFGRIFSICLKDRSLTEVEPGIYALTECEIQRADAGREA